MTQKSHAEKNGYLAYKFSVMGPALAVGMVNKVYVLLKVLVVNLPTLIIV